MGQTCLLILEQGWRRTVPSVLDENERMRNSRFFTALCLTAKCCMKGIDRLAEEAKKLQCDVIVGIGGGKVLDTAKAVAHLPICL